MSLASFHLQHLRMVLKDEEEHSSLQLDKTGQIQDPTRTGRFLVILKQKHQNKDPGVVSHLLYQEPFIKWKIWTQIQTDRLILHIFTRLALQERVYPTNSDSHPRIVCVRPEQPVWAWTCGNTTELSAHHLES